MPNPLAMKPGTEGRAATHDLRTAASVLLKRTYDVKRLQQDLRALEPWRKSRRDCPLHNGRWDEITFVSQPKSQGTHLPVSSFKTPIIKRTPYIEEIIDGLKCHVFLARIARLWPGGQIFEHQDIAGLDTGMIRLHIPIVTHRNVEFIIDNVRQGWRPGELWYGDFSKTHAVNNFSPIDRLHLIINVEVNDFILSLFPAKSLEGQKILAAPKIKGIKAKQLNAFECDLQVPSSFLPGVQKNWLNAKACVPVSIRVAQGQLTAVIQNQPRFVLNPVDRNTFVVGAGMHKYSFRFRTSPQGKVTGVKLVNYGFPVMVKENEFIKTTKTKFLKPNGHLSLKRFE